MIAAIAMIGLGLVLLALGGDRLVLAAVRLARALGLSPVIIGALVVGLGTSMPELLVSVAAALDGDLDLALGNPVGSNVANVTLVLGCTALLQPIETHLRLLRREGIAMVVCVCILAAMGVDAHYTRIEGCILIAGLLVVTWLMTRWSRGDEEGKHAFTEEVNEVVGQKRVSVLKELAMGLVATALLVGGAEGLVRGATLLAEILGMTSAAVGLTIVAVGTSLPELAASLAGARRMEHDIVVGNVLGSNVFNTLAVAGVAATLAPGDVGSEIVRGNLWMVAVAAVASVFASTGRRVSRWEGLALLAAFVLFTAAVL